MAKESVHFSLPGSLRQYLEERVAGGGYGSTSEYLRDLIRRERMEREQEAQDALRSLLAEGVESLERGETVQVTPEFWREVRRQMRSADAGASTFHEEEDEAADEQDYAWSRISA